MSFKINSAQLKCLAVFSVFAIIGFGPISPGCLIGMYIVLRRPDWFLALVTQLYENTPVILALKPSSAIRLKSFLSLLTLFIIDIAPVPVTPVIVFAIIFIRPQWFYNTVVPALRCSPTCLPLRQMWLQELLYLLSESFYWVVGRVQ